MKLRSILSWVAGVCLAASVAAPVNAQDYPNRPITMVVPYAAGGPTDVALRIIANSMGKVLGQQIVIENVGGAGGTTGTARVIRAAPDGYTLLGNQTGLATLPSLYPHLKLDIEKGLAPIGLVNGTYSFLVGRKTLPANTLPELIAWMKGPGKPTKFAHPGVGSLAHLSAAMFAEATGTEIDMIPYRGGGPAMNDLVAGQVDLLWAAPTLAVEQVNVGAIKAFVAGAGKPADLLPAVPTLQSARLGGIDILFWQAIYAPAATPKPIIDRLNAALREALKDPVVIKAFADTGTKAFPPEQQTPEAARKMLHDNIQILAKVIKDNKIQAAY